MTDTIPEYDAIIVGGGPAGLASAIALSASPAFRAAASPPRLLLLEPRPGPIDKACGEGIMPPGLAALRELGVLDADDASALPGHPFRGIRYHSRNGRIARADFAEGPGRGLRRLELARLLEQKFQATGVPVLRRSFRSFQRIVMGQIEVQTDNGILLTRLLIGADGLHSRVRRQANLERVPAGSLRRWGTRRHFRIAPWSEYVEVHWRPECEAYVTPIGEQEVGVAILWNPDRIQPSGDDAHARLLALFPELKRRLTDVERSSATRSIGPLLQPTRSAVADGLVLIGDAAGYLDALTGEGLSLAFAEALALKERVAPLFAADPERPLDAGALAPYETERRRITGPYLRMTGAVLLLHRLAFVQELAIAVLRKFPGLFRHLLSVNMGTVDLFGRRRRDPY